VKKKNLIVLLTTLQSPHLEYSLKFIEDHKNSYEKILVINLITCKLYQHELTWRNYAGIRLNISRVIRNSVLKKIYLILRLRKYDAINYCYIHKNKNILSEEQIFSIIKTYTSIEYQNPSIVHNQTVKKVLETITKVSNFMDDVLSKNKISIDSDILIFNGRLPIEHTSLLVFSKYNYSNFIYHECNSYKKLVFHQRESIHRPDLIGDILSLYFKSNKDNAIKLLRSYEDESLYEKKFITFYTSSNDEFAFKYKYPVNQARVIYTLINDFDKLNLPYILKIRVHPRVKNKSKYTRNYYNRLKALYPDIIINYDDETSSNFLCLSSRLTISIGSSMAAESTMMNIPHILIGNQSYYVNMSGYIKCDERNLISKIKYYANNSYNISINDRLMAASTILYDRNIGDKIKILPFGKFPI
jgi:hypothetical protein